MDADPQHWLETFNFLTNKENIFFLQLFFKFFFNRNFLSPWRSSRDRSQLESESVLFETVDPEKIITDPPVLRIRDVYPGCKFFPTRIRIFPIPDPGSASKN